MMNFSLINYRPPRIAFAFLGIATVVHFMLPSVRGAGLSNLPVGGVLIATGLYLLLAGWWLFKTHSVAICPTSETNTLLTHGVYRFTRNPMYLGVIVMLLGIALIVGSLPFYAVVIIYFCIIHFVFCPYEEQKLLKTFGDDYARYQAAVRRWI